RIKYQSAWLGDEQSSGIPSTVARNEAARRIGRRSIKTKRHKRSPVQQRRVIQMQQEDRRVGSGFVDFVQCWHPAFFELKLVPATDNTHPLRRRRVFGLLAQLSESL